MRALARGCYRARLATGDAGLAEAQELRWRAFRAGRNPGVAAGRDADRFDALCRHLLVEDRRTGRPVATCRLLSLAGGAEIGRSYSAQHYDLARLAFWPGPMVEVGRFCLDPACRDPDAIRIAWGALARLVLADGAGLLFGCSSFPAAEADRCLAALSRLAPRHLAPERWRPGVRAPRVVRFRGGPGAGPGGGAAGLPPLVRSYLAMGGWIGDHAVVDDDLGTLHVFTAVETGRIPPARARALLAIAAGAGAEAGTGPSVRRGRS